MSNIDTSLVVISNFGDEPMATITKWAKAITRYADGRVRIEGRPSLDPGQYTYLAPAIDATVTHHTRDGRDVVRSYPDLILEAAERQGLTIHDGGTR